MGGGAPRNCTMSRANVIGTESKHLARSKDTPQTIGYAALAVAVYMFGKPTRLPICNLYHHNIGNDAKKGTIKKPIDHVLLRSTNGKWRIRWL